MLDRDEHPRAGTTLDGLAKLRPAFAHLGADARGRRGPQLRRDLRRALPDIDHIDHVHHAGNSSGVVDGAAAALVASDDWVQAHGVTPRARIRADRGHRLRAGHHADRARPRRRACLAKAGMSVDDIDLWEINEAFAAVPLKTMRDLKLDPERVNVNGGAIALGHPIGATGAMLIGTVLDELERRDLDHRPGHDVHRRRHGHRDDHRAGLTVPQTLDGRDTPHDGVTVVRLNRPERLNAINEVMLCRADADLRRPRCRP